MNYREKALSIACEGEQLLGILSSPAPGQPSRKTGVVIIVGGPQYRVGSHRQFVLLARSLAVKGYDCLRVDYRGMGDSSGGSRDFLAVGADIDAAVKALRQEQGDLERVVLWGLCDAASACLLFVDEFGPRANVDGLCLLNPWVRTPASLARTQVKHYYLQRLKEREFWLKLLSGKVAASAVSGLVRSIMQVVRPPTAAAAAAAQDLPFNLRMARAWKQFSGPIQLVLSGEDYTAKEFLEQVASESAWSGALHHPRLSRADLAEADHTFSRRADALELEAICCRWLDQLQPQVA